MSGPDVPQLSGVPSPGTRRSSTFPKGVFKSCLKSRAVQSVALLLFGFTTILALYAMTVRLFEEGPVFTPSAERWFNSITTGLSVIMALISTALFKSCAGMLKWGLMNQKTRKRDVLEWYLSLEKLTSVGKLARRYRERAFKNSSEESREKMASNCAKAVVCCAWIFLFIGTQAIISVPSLMFDIVKGENYTITYTRPGFVKAANLSSYFTWGRYGELRENQGNQTIKEILAHEHGQALSLTNHGNYSEHLDIFDSEIEYPYWIKNDDSEFSYRFLEYSLKDDARRYPYRTNRIISSSFVCESFPLDPSVGISRVDDGFVFGFREGSGSMEFRVPHLTEINPSTAYFVSERESFDFGTGSSCGRRCASIWALRLSYSEDDTNLYRCNVTMSLVSNAADSSQEVSDEVAWLAASAIATGDEYPGDQDEDDNRPTTGQWQWYPNFNSWHLSRDNTTMAGIHMAEYAIRSLASMARTNPPHEVPSETEPFLGVRLDVQYRLFLPWLFSLFAGHVLLVLVVFWKTFWGSDLTKIPDEGPVQMAQLLRPVISSIKRTSTVGRFQEKDFSASFQYLPDYK